MKKNNQSELDRLEAKIAEAKGKIAENDKPREISDSSKALNIGIEMVSGVAIGAAAGFFLDKYLGTKPFFL